MTETIDIIKEEVKETPKTPEELRQEREARYKADPNSFIELSEVICMAINSSQSKLGVSVYVGDTTRGKLGIAQSEINHIIYKTRLSMDMARAMKNAPPPPGAMQNFARKVMGK